ncbi:hypothetical protein KCU71_g1325, partial [Aureobasidium melanogenum]
MARTKRKPIQLATPPRARPLWFDGLSPRDLDHLTYLIESGMDKNRVKLEPEHSMTNPQTGSGHEDVTASTQDSITPNELPDEQEGAHLEGYMHDENEVLTFNFGTASPAVEEAPSTATVPLRCRRCPSTFVHQHEFVAHVWEGHIKEESLEWLPGTIHKEQEAMVQELIGAFVEYEDSVGVSPPVIAIDTRPSPSRGPPAAARVPFSRPPPSSARSQSSMMGVFTVDNRAATAGSSHNNPRRILAPVQPAQSAPALAAPGPAAPAGAFPPGHLEPDQPFRLGQRVPLGIKLPTNNSMTAFKWEVYKRRGQNAFDWTDKKSITLANRWRSRVSQAAFKRLGLKIDRRKKNAAAVDADEDEEIEENEDGDEEQEDQDGEEMDTREV